MQLWLSYESSSSMIGLPPLHSLYQFLVTKVTNYKKRKRKNEWLKRREIYFLSVLEVRSLTSRLLTQGVDRATHPFQLLRVAHIFWHVASTREQFKQSSVRGCESDILPPISTGLYAKQKYNKAQISKKKHFKNLSSNFTQRIINSINICDMLAYFMPSSVFSSEESTIKKKRQGANFKKLFL